MIFDLCPKKCPWPSHKKKVQSMEKYGTFCGYFCCCCWQWWHWHWCSKQTPPDKKIKNVNFNREKVFEKPWNFAHIGFWVCQLQCTMLELCVTSTFQVVMALIISLTNAVNLTAVSLIVSENWSLLVRKILKEKEYYALFHM